MTQPTGPNRICPTGGEAAIEFYKQAFEAVGHSYDAKGRPGRAKLST